MSSPTGPLKRLAAVTAIVCLGACSNSKHARSAAATTPRGGASPTTTTSGPLTTGGSGAAPTSTTLALASAHTLGQAVPLDQGTLAVLDYAAPVAAGDRSVKPPPGDVFAVIDVRSCAGPSGGDSAAPAGFALQFAGGRVIGPRVSIKDPALLLIALHPGKCTRGSVTFAIPSGTRPELIAYGPAAAAWRLT